MQSDQHALDITNGILTLTRDAVLRNDPVAFISYFSLPQVVETFEGRTVLREFSDARRTFEAVRAHYDKQGITDFHRTCIEASFKTRNIIEYVYQTTYFQGVQAMSERPSTYAMMQLIEGHWRITYTMHSTTTAEHFMRKRNSRVSPSNTAA